MFEIGNSLREARLRQSLDLARIETDTKIRAKYLQALEAERFEVLPAETYVKGFLRTYAEYLGLDGQLYVDEFNSRFASAEEPVVAAGPTSRPRPRSAESSFVLVALAGIVAVTVLVVVAFAFNGGPSDPGADMANRDTKRSRPGATTGGETTTTKSRPKPKATTAKLVLRAARDDCWAEVRRSSPEGELLFSGTIFEGESMRFTGKRLWLRLGAPANLDVTLNGKAVRNFPETAGSVVVTARGVREA